MPRRVGAPRRAALRSDAPPRADPHKLTLPPSPHSTSTLTTTSAPQFYQIAYGRYAESFDYFIITVIIIAGTMVGVQTYPKYNCPAMFAQDPEGDWKVSRGAGRSAGWWGRK